MENRRIPPAALVLAGGLVAGAFDITYAWLFWAIKAGVPAQRIFQSVAAGLLGRADARAGGWATAALGLALHFFIATSMAFTYDLAARRIALLREKPWPFGLAYGFGCYLVMNFVVVPLSRAASNDPKDPLWVALSIVVHMLLIGVPIALAVRAAARARAAA